MNYQKTCKICHSGFVAGNNKAKFCSNACRLVAFRLRNESFVKDPSGKSILLEKEMLFQKLRLSLSESQYYLSMLQSKLMRQKQEIQFFREQLQKISDTHPEWNMDLSSFSE
jgi:hypothetical protein